VKPAFVTLVVCVCFGVSGSALAIVGGGPDNGVHPYVGAALLSENGGQELCSGFLVSPTVFVTAAHCFPDGATVQVTFDENAILTSSFTTGTVHNDPAWCLGCGNGLPGADTADLAVIVLSGGGVTLPRYATLPSLGLTATLSNKQLLDVVGYGVQALVHKSPTVFGTRQVATTKSIGAGTLGSEFLKLLADPGVCFGDSGGPDLLAGTDVVVAENTFGSGNPACNGTSYSELLDTPQALAFIQGF
jgi:hypothetical protein